MQKNFMRSLNICFSYGLQSGHRMNVQLINFFLLEQEKLLGNSEEFRYVSCVSLIKLNHNKIQKQSNMLQHKCLDSYR